MSKCGFKVGDILVGNSAIRYGITNNSVLVRVTNIYNNSQIEVKVIYDFKEECMVENGSTFSVDAPYFDLVWSAPEEKKKEMTVGEIEKELGYSIKIVKE